MDRALLDRFAMEVHRLGPACDLGCGPGRLPPICASAGWTSSALTCRPAWSNGRGS
jgi:hypothetical protein